MNNVYKAMIADSTGDKQSADLYMNRETVRYAVMTACVCHYCTAVLDQRDAAVVTITEGGRSVTRVVCPDCCDKVRDHQHLAAQRGGSIEILDARELYRPRRRSPKQTEEVSHG